MHVCFFFFIVWRLTWVNQQCLLHDRYVDINCIFIDLISTFLSAVDKDISYSDLKSLLEKGSGFVVDVRTKDEVDRGRIPGSIHIPGDREDPQS